MWTHVALSQTQRTQVLDTSTQNKLNQEDQFSCIFRNEITTAGAQ